MAWIDYLIIVLCLASAGFGYWRGFAKEALSLATWLLAIWLSWRFSFVIEPMLGEWTRAPELKIWAARGMIFLIVLAVGGLVAWLLREVVRRTGLSGTDRLLGAFFGLGRGVLLVGLTAMVIEFSGLAQDPWWQQARLKPYSERIAAGIRYYATLGSQYLQEQELV
jgi:membrane protein required for colicin V production